MTKQINEESLGRVWQQSGPEYAFVIMTAFRGNFDLKENKKRNNQLKKEIRKNGFGFWVLEGHWIENKDTPDEDDVQEESFFISVKKGSKDGSEKLREFAEAQMRNFDQDAIIFKPSDSEKVQLIFNKGEVTTVGKFKPQKIRQAYSKMKKDGRTFVFEGVQDHKNFATSHRETLSDAQKYAQDYQTGLVEFFDGDYSPREIEQRKKSVRAKLASKRYGVKLLEDGTLFIVDLDNKGSLANDIGEIAEQFGENTYHLLDEDSIVERTITEEFNVFRPEGMMGRWGAKAIAKTPWNELEVDDIIEESITQSNAYWISPKGAVIPVPSRHISTVIDNPKKFGLKLKDIEKEYEKHDEPIGHEGYAREKIMIDLMKKGWIRLRFIPKNFRWTVQVDKLSKKVKDAIWDGFAMLVKKKLVTKTMDVVILPDNGQNLFGEVEEVIKYSIFEGNEEPESVNARLVLIENYNP